MSKTIAGKAFGKKKQLRVVIYDDGGVWLKLGDKWVHLSTADLHELVKMSLMADAAKAAKPAKKKAA